MPPRGTANVEGSDEGEDNDSGEDVDPNIGTTHSQRMEEQQMRGHASDMAAHEYKGELWSNRVGYILNLLLLMAHLATFSRMIGPFTINSRNFVIKNEFFVKIFPDLNEQIERLETQNVIPDIGLSMMWEDIARFLTHAQFYCIHEQGYNWMYTTSTACNMGIKVSPSLRMEWNTSADDPDAETFGDAWWDPRNIPKKEMFGTPHGMNCSKEFTKMTFEDGLNPIDYPWGSNPPGVDVNEINKGLPKTNSGFRNVMEEYAIGKGETQDIIEDIQKRLRILMSQQQFRNETPDERPKNQTSSTESVSEKALGDEAQESSAIQIATLQKEAKALGKAVARDRRTNTKRAQRLDPSSALIQEHKVEYNKPHSHSQFPVTEKEEREMEETMYANFDSNTNSTERAVNQLPPDCFTTSAIWDNATGTYKSDGKYVIRDVCRNHHFPLIGLCQPSKVVVNFRLIISNRNTETKEVDTATVAETYPKDKSTVMIYSFYSEDTFEVNDVELTFRQMGSSAMPLDGAYKAQVSTETFTYPLKKSIVSLISASLTVMLFWAHFWYYVVQLILMPYRAGVIMLKRNEVDDPDVGASMILDLLLPLGVRNRVTIVEASANYFYVILFFYATISSIIGFFTTKLFSPWAVLTASATSTCALNEADTTSFEYLKICGPKDAWLVYAIEWIHGLLFHPTSREEHEFAIYMNIFLVLCAVNVFESTRWMGAVFAVAFQHMVSFLVVFFGTIVIFAIFLCLRSSAEFEQFGSVQTTIMSLFCYTFDLPVDLIFDDDTTYPLEHIQSKKLTNILLAYNVAMIFIGLAFLQGIILDSYGEVKDDLWEPWDEQNQVHIQPWLPKIFPKLAVAKRRSVISRVKSKLRITRTLPRAASERISKQLEEEEEAEGGGQ